MACQALPHSSRPQMEIRLYLLNSIMPRHIRSKISCELMAKHNICCGAALCRSVAGLLPRIRSISFRIAEVPCATRRGINCFITRALVHFISSGKHSVNVASRVSAWT
jgi:hypothetical protein